MRPLSKNRSGINVRILENDLAPFSIPTIGLASFAGQSPISASTGNSLANRFPNALWSRSLL